MEARFAQQLELADVVEAVELVDVAAVRAGGDPAAAVLVVDQEGHPLLVVAPPRHLLLGAPVEPVGAVGVARRAVEVPQGGQGVLLVPLGAPRPHQVAARLVDGEGGVDREVEPDQLVDHRVPAFAAAFGRLLPQLARFAEAVLLVEVVVVERILLQGAVDEKRLGQAVPVLHRGEAPARGVEHVHPRHLHLGVVAGAAQAALLGRVRAPPS